jgi:hypothetical protein
MGTPRFIQLGKYLTHRAIWESTSNNEYGETQVTTSRTVHCYYFTGHTLRELGNQTQGAARGVQNLVLEHQALLYSSVTVKINDRLKTITTLDSETLVDAATVTRVERFHGWESGRGCMMQQVTLRFD